MEAIQVLNIDSTNIHPKHWQLLCHVLEENYDNYDGFVICHGTDTMAYTCCRHVLPGPALQKPIVITGAQKPIDLDVTDARTNLLDSLRFASCERAHGVNIVFDGKVIAGTRGKKERTKSYNAFSSINFPYLAVIQDEHILFYIDDKWQDRENVRFYHDLDDRVALLKLIPSMESSILDYMGESITTLWSSSPLESAVFPPMSPVISTTPSKKMTQAGKIVVMTTQVTQEGSNMSVYEVGPEDQKRLRPHRILRYDPGSHGHQAHVDPGPDKGAGAGKGNVLPDRGPRYFMEGRDEIAPYQRIIRRPRSEMTGALFFRSCEQSLCLSVFHKTPLGEKAASSAIRLAWAMLWVTMTMV